MTARPATNSATPASSGASRHTLGAGGVALRLTPRGEICTRRSDSSDATADTTGTATSRPMYSAAVGVTVSAKYLIPMNDAPARAGWARAKMPMPTATPNKPLTAASTDATTLTCRGVAPTSRIAAYRSSRRAADSRVAVLIRMRIGKSTASTPTPNAYRKYGVKTCWPGPVAMDLTSMVPGAAASCAGVYPT